MMQMGIQTIFKFDFYPWFYVHIKKDGSLNSKEMRGRKCNSSLVSVNQEWPDSWYASCGWTTKAVSTLWHESIFCDIEKLSISPLPTKAAAAVAIHEFNITISRYDALYNTCSKMSNSSAKLLNIIQSKNLRVCHFSAFVKGYHYTSHQTRDLANLLIQRKGRVISVINVKKKIYNIELLLQSAQNIFLIEGVLFLYLNLWNKI